MFSIFSEEYLEPPLNEIKKYYDIIQNELLNKINEIVSNMKDFFAEIQIKYNITNQMEELVKIIKKTYDYLIKYSQDLTDDIDDYDEILILYTYIDDGTNELRQLNDYLRNNKRNLGELKNIFNLKKDKEMLNKRKKLAEKKYKNRNNISNNNNNLSLLSNNNKLNIYKDYKYIYLYLYKYK